MKKRELSKLLLQGSVATMPQKVFKGAVAKFGFFFYLPTNLSEICTHYVKLNQESIFAKSFIY